MQKFSLNFLIYTIGGIWRPIEWSSNVVSFLYNVFTCIVLLLEYFMMLTQFLDFLFVIDNIEDFVANSVMFVSVCAVVCKATVVVIHRNAIINLIQVLLKGPCKPRDEDEIAIQIKFDKFIRLCSIKYALLATGSLTGIIIGSVLNIMQGQLPYRIWLPLDYNVPLVFWIISIQQVMTIFFGTIINVGTETLVFGLILETCAQLEIFENRLHKLINNKTVKYLGNALCSLNEDKRGISKCIRHHLSIYKYAKTVNVIFNQVLFVQFFVSILVLCTSVYYLSTHITELSGTVTFLLYTIGMFVQIYIYCWSGNEVIIKSMRVGDAIYCMDWPLLSINEKKELLMVMIRSTIPIKFTSSFLIILSLQSYSNVSRTSNMQMFSLNFFLYTICGIWRPIEWSSNGANFLYNVFTYIVLLLEYFLMLTQFLDFLFVIDNIDDFVANSIMFVSVAAVVCKATVVVTRRNAIISLVQILLKSPCKPQDEDEMAIQTKFDKFVRLCSMKYLLLAISSLTGVIIGSILNIMHGQLPCRIWLPLDYNVSLVFWIISIQQVMAIIAGTIINVGTETLVFGLILETCAQLEIFENRLHKLINNKTVKYLGNALCSLNEDKTGISKCIQHHLSIYKYAKTVNVIFNQVLFIQFFGSILILCTCIYYLSTHITELSGIATLLVYIICMFVQIYIYCWSGNEVMLKSMSIGESIYCTDWPLLSVTEKKELLIIMICSTIPIKFTSSFMITLSLQSYSNILKTSYSAFNVLQKQNINNIT
ncbi:uncharacterized protein [Mycetomoellerius zeteki]|uniref:uncharacterized protein n=1 Tax=Mycetomoellerius zeteki TaxID=64791 RepID=UPI00084EB355|nr:PREDICTED: uncharacterized protein LOC108721458 [Trachymyrmex zeteki]